MPDFLDGHARSDYASTLYLDTLEFYRAEIGDEMPSLLRSLVRESIEWATCMYFTQPNQSNRSALYNDVFRRAAIIGYFWALDAPTGALFGPHSLSMCVSQFLKKEGASPARPTDEPGARQAIVSTINTYRGAGPTRLFIELRKTCAHHWVCDSDNHSTNFGTKLCHC
jgi:hypothetical protein